MDFNVNVSADASKWGDILAHTWNYAGYDECNYTHSPGGMELINKLGKLEKPYYIRAHHMLCTGNKHGFYKWGSTNAYLEDGDGVPIYDFSLIERMCDIWLANNCKPFFEIGFMPMHLADMGGVEKQSGNDMAEYRRIGWSRPPKDYDRWYELIRKMVGRLVDRYGAEEVATWYFEMWNEPDIFYWTGTHSEFCKLFDYTEAAVHEALPSARFGGPSVCGAMNPEDRAAVFLRKFLEHTSAGVNHKSGAVGTRLDFTSFHTKGGAFPATTGKKQAKPPSVKNFLQQIKTGAEVIKACGYGNLECVLSEADPDGWAAGGRFDNPALNFRNTEYYASYVASAYKNAYDLAKTLEMDVRPLAWAFMFEGERCFEGTRTFSTQGIDKAMFNVFRVFAKLGGQLIELSSDRDADPLTYPDPHGEGLGAEIDGWATITGTKSVEAMIYCHEDSWDCPDVYKIHFTALNLPFDGPCRITHYRVDGTHSNAYAEWRRQGMPDYPAGGQYDAIKARDGLELYGPAVTSTPRDGRIDMEFDMPVNGVSLIKIEKSGGPVA